MLQTGRVDGRGFRSVLIFSLTFLFLKFERDTSNRSFLNSAISALHPILLGLPSHQMSCESSDFVAETFRWDDGYLIADFLVGVEVEGETGIEL